MIYFRFSNFSHTKGPSKKNFEFDNRYKNYSITFDNVFNNDIALLKILNYFS